MTWPPNNQPTGGKSDSTPMATDHPTEHNAIKATLDDIIAENAGALPLAGGGTVNGDVQVNGIIKAKSSSGQTEPSYGFANDAVGLGMFASVGSQWLRLTAGGEWRVQIGTEKVTVKHDLQVDGQTLAQDGTSAAPAYSFDSDPDTGMYRPKADAIELSGGGVRMMLLAHGANEGAGIGAYIPMILKRATANPANLYCTTDTGNLRYRNARSQFLKKVEDKAGTFAAPASILELEPMRYTSLHEGDDPNEIHLGFSAEAVAAIDPGLVSYGPVEGCECPPNEEDPDTPCECEQAPLDVRYDRLTVQLLGVVKDLRQRVAELEAAARIEAPET